MKTSFIALVALCLVCACDRPDYTIKGTYPIKSIRTSESTAGSFFLGSGSFGGQTYFYSYVEISPGIFQLKRYRMEKTIISETSSSPHVVIYRYQWDSNGEDVAYFMVPKGTIIEKFRLE